MIATESFLGAGGTLYCPREWEWQLSSYTTASMLAPAPGEGPYICPRGPYIVRARGSLFCQSQGVPILSKPGGPYFVKARGSLYCQSRGVPTLSQGIPTLSQGIHTLSQGFPKLSQGFPTLSQGFPTLSQGIPTLSQGVPKRVPVPEALTFHNFK